MTHFYEQSQDYLILVDGLRERDNATREAAVIGLGNIMLEIYDLLVNISDTDKSQRIRKLAADMIDYDE